jgi:dihydrofolate reductase
MGKLIYSMLMSLDGYVEDERGRFGWGAPEDEEVHSYINQLASSAGTYLYGRRMYETMVYWETAHTVPNQPQFVLEWARNVKGLASGMLAKSVHDVAWASFFSKLAYKAETLGAR